MEKTNMIREKNGYNVDIPSLIFFRPTQGVYIYHIKLVNSVVPRAPIGGLSVKPVNPAQKITFYFIFPYFKRYMWVQCYRTRVCIRLSSGKIRICNLRYYFLI